MDAEWPGTTPVFPFHPNHKHNISPLMKPRCLAAILATASLLAMTSCSGKEGKAQDAIKAYLKSEMRDPSGYEGVEFGKLEGGPDVYSMTHAYRETSADGEFVTKHVTFCISKSCLHARPSEVETDLEWAIKWSLVDDR